MPRLITKLREEDLDTAERTLVLYGYTIPREDIRRMIETMPKAVKCCRGYKPEGTLDTYDRGYVWFAIARSLGFEDWPCLGDTDETSNAFFDKLIELNYVPVKDKGK